MFWTRRRRWNLTPHFTAWEVFLIVFMLMFGVFSRLHRLEGIGTLSFLLMVHLGIVGSMRQRFEILDLFMKWKKLMEKQSSRRIDVLQFDHVREYKDLFLWFGQNNGIDIHFTVGKYRVAKETNCYFLEKIWCLLSNALLDKSFFTEALEYTSHLMNRLSSIAIGGKTLLDLIGWNCWRPWFDAILHVWLTSVSNMSSWIREQKNLCFWESKETWKVKSYGTLKIRISYWACMSYLIRFHY